MILFYFHLTLFYFYCYLFCYFYRILSNSLSKSRLLNNSNINLLPSIRSIKNYIHTNTILSSPSAANQTVTSNNNIKYNNDIQENNHVVPEFQLPPEFKQTDCGLYIDRCKKNDVQ